MVTIFGSDVNIELIAVILGLVQVLFQILQSNVMWFFAIVSAIFYAILYADTKLYALLAMDIYNIAISVYGLFQYVKVKREVKKEGHDEKIQIRKLTRRVLWFSLSSTLVLTVVVAMVNSGLGDPYPIPDAALGVAAMLGMFYLSRQYIENWYVWLISDVLSVAFYIYIGFHWTAVLYSVYVLSSIVGLNKWKKEGIRI
ncbi:MAG: nicotinamide mononucleotide transporter [Bacteroidales bacterium]|nr:nicotinamide mononucleotide transporter [Bacteroidales bacterium]